MPRYFAEIIFDGTPYNGWQIQPNALGVQEVINEKLSILLATDINVVGAGRTDTGVHSTCMVLHFDTKDELKPDFCEKINRFLPTTIVFKWIKKVKPEAHSRFDALDREYKYYIHTHRNPFLEAYSVFFPYPLDVEKMNMACQELLGEKDFSCFSKSNTQTFTNICTIAQAEWITEGDKMIFTIRANRFLRNMVRAIVGTLLEVGQGKKSIQDIKNIIESKNRSKAGVSVPAKALFLTQVSYPDEIYT